VLVDRLWLRGISKVELHLDEWLKNFAPSTDLCKWFDHDAKKINEFRLRYRNELKPNMLPVTKLSASPKDKPSP
jgi:uncharacterized protein YeaO (DUF488 family)